MKRILFILLTAVMLCGGTVTAFAMDYPSNLPAVPEGENTEYVVFEYKNSYKLFQIENVKDGVVNDADMKFYYPYDDDRALFGVSNFYDNYKVYGYDLVDNAWKHNGTWSNGYATIDLIVNNTLVPVYSTVDLHDNEGQVVFPLPLAEQIMKKTEEVLTVETMPTLNKTVLVVVLCGVGCLALVTSLVLLPKVFRIFHR